MDTAAVPGLEHLPPSLRGFLVSTPYTGSCDGRVSKQYGIFDEFTHNSEHRKLLASYHTQAISSGTDVHTISYPAAARGTGRFIHILPVTSAQGLSSFFLRKTLRRSLNKVLEREQ